MKIRNTIKSVFEKIQDSIVAILIDALVVFIAQRFFPFLFPEKEIGGNLKIYILLGLFVFIFFILLVIKKTYHRYKFHIKDEHIMMEYQGDKIKVYQKFHCYTKHFSASKMYTRKTWFSDESIKFNAVTDGFSVQSYKKMGNSNEYYIIFPKRFFFHRSICFETKFIGNNKKRKYENFYWVDIECPMDKLTIEIRLPKESCKGKLKKKEFLKHEEAPGSLVTEVEFDGVYSWEILKPKLNWSYVLEWEWSDTEKSVIAKAKKRYR